MRYKLKYAIVPIILAVLLTAGCPLFPPPVTPTGAIIPAKYADFNFLSVHDSTSSAFDASCTRCHGDRANEVGTDGTTVAAHSVAHTAFGSGDAGCLSCHSIDVDMNSQDHARLKNNMYTGATSCASSACHGVGSANPFYAVNK
ncbi:MAG: hypothetical protein ACYTF1_00985 [Planctomycetota bacterium]